MKEVKREGIRELLGMLEYIQERVTTYWREEEGAFDVRPRLRKKRS
jgi:hypothetical protein